MTQKFSFDRSFEDHALRYHAPKYSERDKTLLEEKIYKEAYEAGRQKGIEETLFDIHAHNEKQLEALEKGMASLSQAHEELAQRVHSEISHICRQMAQVFFPKTAEIMAFQEISAFMDDIQEHLMRFPHVTITVHPSTEKDLKDKVNDMDWSGEKEGQKTAVTIKTDETLAVDACDVTWEHGGVNRLRDRAHDAIQRALDRYEHAASKGPINEPKTQ